jgi:NADH-quinone oxidoreductase subunit L
MIQSMQELLQLFIWIPLGGFLLSLCLPKKKESWIAVTAIATTGITLLGLLVFCFVWFLNFNPVLDRKHMTIFESGNIVIFINYFFDSTTAVFALLGALITTLVLIFSRYYLHRDEGFKRFFNTALLFFLGYNLAIFSGNFETMFTGWELLGISSFLLITFYRDRYLPAKNGLKVISLYRLSDICLILSMWMSHHLWHGNITFVKLSDTALIAEYMADHRGYFVVIALLVFIASAAKSAQLPFSSWLPRAMEGPTTSSAIFYGSLSVHLGVFLLIRTQPYWEGIWMVKAAIILTGLLTALVATSIARVQSSVKTQIAYSSIAQIGLIFAEAGMGWHTLALIHFAGNALLRSYQLLVSPSVLNYLIHDMFFNFKPTNPMPGSAFSVKLRNTIYLLSIKEWNLDFMLRRFLWDPFKWAGNMLNFISRRNSFLITGIIFLTGLSAEILPLDISKGTLRLLPEFFSITGLILFLKAFTERGDARWAWSFVMGGVLFITLSIASLNKDFNIGQILIYLSGCVASFIAGLICLNRMYAIDHDIDLNRFHGYSYERPNVGFVFLVSCLGLIGLPFTPTFIGIDLLFSHISVSNIVLLMAISLSFVLMEISILRIYARIFMGQHKKPYHAMAFRSS